MAYGTHRYVYLVEFAGGIIRYLPIHPPTGADSAKTSGNEWTVDIQELEGAINPKTKMLVSLSQSSRSYELA